MIEKLTVIFFVILCILLGTYLILSPWTGVFGNWNDNFFLVFLTEKAGLTFLPGIVGSTWFRGGVTGLGVLNLLMAFLGSRQFQPKRRNAQSRQHAPDERQKVRLNFDKITTYLITKGILTDENFAASKIETLETIRRAVEFDVSLIQIREKKLGAKLLFELARQAAAITENSKTKLLINDRADIALAANADGVHLTANSISAGIIRHSFPEKFVVGVSAHSFASDAMPGFLIVSDRALSCSRGVRALRQERRMARTSARLSCAKYLAIDSVASTLTFPGLPGSTGIQYRQSNGVDGDSNCLAWAASSRELALPSAAV